MSKKRKRCFTERICTTWLCKVFLLRAITSVVIHMLTNPGFNRMPKKVDPFGETFAEETSTRGLRGSFLPGWFIEGDGDDRMVMTTFFLGGDGRNAMA